LNLRRMTYKSRGKTQPSGAHLVMKVVSVNVSLPKEVPYLGRTVTTGILKEPVRGRVMVHRLNIDGDDQADRRVHGVGLDMAIYVYPVEHYAFWARELGRDSFPYDQFGDNLTVEGLSEDTVRVGDTFRVGGTLLQVPFQIGEALSQIFYLQAELLDRVRGTDGAGPEEQEEGEKPHTMVGFKERD